MKLHFLSENCFTTFPLTVSFKNCVLCIFVIANLVKEFRFSSKYQFECISKKSTINPEHLAPSPVLNREFKIKQPGYGEDNGNVTTQ